MLSRKVFENPDSLLALDLPVRNKGDQDHVYTKCPVAREHLKRKTCLLSCALKSRIIFITC